MTPTELARLVERLREQRPNGEHISVALLMDEAADALSTLSRRVEELEAENAALLTKMRMIDFLADSIKRRTASKEQTA